MTLAQMAAAVCGKVNQSETEDQVACKSFLTFRHDMIWADALWKDSLTEYRQTLSPDGYTPSSNWLPTKGVLLLPPVIGEVLAVRSDSRKLNVRRPEFYYRVDWDAFAKQGEACDYVLLPRCVWEFDTAQLAYAYSDAEGDAAANYYLDYLDADGVGITRVTNTLSSQEGAYTERIDQVLKSGTNGTVHFIYSDNSGNHPIFDLLTGETAAKQRERVRFLYIPTQAMTLRLLGKRVCPSFTNDLDQPAIRGSENCLMAYAQADMLERERQYGKAQIKIQNEATPLLTQLKGVEVVQQAHNQQIVPEDAGWGQRLW